MPHLLKYYINKNISNLLDAIYSFLLTLHFASSTHTPATLIDNIISIFW